MRMDPAGSWEVTIDGLIATVGTTSHRVTNFIRAVRPARADLVHVTRALSDLGLELELLRDEHNVPPQIHGRGLAVLASCGVVLRRIGSLLGGDPSPSSPPSPKSDAARPPRWSVKERFATSNLCNCLQTYREALALLPDVAYLRSSPDPQDIDTAELEDRSSRILEAVEDLREAIPQAEPAISDSRAVLELYLSEVAGYTTAVCNSLGLSTTEPRASDFPPPGPMAAAVDQGVARASSRKARKPHQDAARGAAAPPGTDSCSFAPNGPFEVVGPWFPSEDLPVPFYSNQEQLLQHRATSFHVPRSPAPHSPLPRHPARPSPPLPPPTGALPMLPPGAPRSKTQRHIAELAGGNAPEVRTVAQHHSPHQQPGRPDHHRDTGERAHTRQRSNTASKQNTTHPNAEDAHEAARHKRHAGEQEAPQASHPGDAWNTSYYVPSTPPLTSGQSSQRTSYQPSSLDSVPSRDTYRSSISTGPLSNVDQMSPNTSPRPQLPPTFESTVPMRPPSPRPSVTTTHSSGSTGKATFMDKIPAVFRGRRKPTQSLADSGQSTCRNSVSTGSASTVEAAIAQSTSAAARRAERQLDIVPAEGLSSDGKGAGAGIHHIEISPTGTTIATQHAANAANNTVKVWSVTTGAVEAAIKYSSKVQPGPRSRMYFVRPHAIMSENSTLVAISASFGNTIEVWNWSKKKRLQSIDHAARWACYPGDIFEANMRPLAVYRAESDCIDLYAATRDAKKPFAESRRLGLCDAGLPFVPKFPDLAYSSTGPLLVGAAGPRPGAPPEAEQTMLLAWQIDEQQASIPRPYRWVVPEHAELGGALPAALATYGSVAVSIWFPANYRHVVTSRGETKKVPAPAVARHVLVWDLATNRTRLFSIPNALSCISPDCRYVAYCAPEPRRFVVLDVTTAAEVWSGPDELDVRQAEAAAAAAGGGGVPSGQLLGDLAKVTEFRFTDDSGLLYVADQEGGVGIYEVRQAGGGRNASVSTASGGAAAGPYAFAEMSQALSRTRTGE